MSAWLYTCEKHPKGNPLCFKCVCGHNWMLLMEAEEAKGPIYPAPFNDWFHMDDRREFANAWKEWREGHQG